MKWTIKLALLGVFGTLLFYSCEQEPYRQGKNLYTIHCENCHMADGTGLGGNIPPLAQSDYLAQNQGLISCIIKYGQQGKIVVNGTTYEEPMQGVESLSEFQVANIINYINHAWNNDYGFVKVEDIREQIENCN